MDWWFNWSIDQPLENPNLEDDIQKVPYHMAHKYESKFMTHQL